ncbi:NTP transferase domain-containing protein [Candidatus Woesearchaeota archaeon]|nr:NTP transferase domain-containing protein [Candidatus Woesearchaeota archaeon]
MKTIILCGGKGTRLRELTEEIPKPLVEIGGKPILWHIMKIYESNGFKDFVLALGYKGDMIRDYFAENEDGWNIEFAETGAETNTGGRIKRAEKYIGEGEFMATYGDGLASINIRALIEQHRKSGKMATITCVKPKSRFGIVEIDEKSIIRNFSEKPVLPYWVNGGFFVFKKKVFDFIGENDVLENEVFEKLAAMNEISAYKFSGFWDCMDTFKEMQALNELWNSGKAAWKVWK